MTVTMKATLCSTFGPIDQVMTVVEKGGPAGEGGGGVPIPKLSDEYVATEKIHPIMQSASKKDRQTHMIIRTLAVALAPGDVRVLSGKTRALQGPPVLPYVPGADCCGIVTEVQPTESYFQVGDMVAVRFSNAPRDALAEYARVSSTVCEKIVLDNGKPRITPIEAAILASASPAVQLAEYIKPQTDKRILILGGGGGIGSHLVQLIRQKLLAAAGEGDGSFFICGTSSTPQRLLEAPLNYDRAIDYTKQDVFTVEEFQQEPFDVIIDLACGGWIQLQEHYSNKGSASIIKPASKGGRFITPTTDTHSFEIHNLGDAISRFMIQPMLRSISTSSYNPFNFNRSTLPVFVNANDCLPNDRQIISKTLQLAYDKILQAVVDGPYPMTTEGVRQAFQIVESRHGKGKVVIQVAEA